MEKQEHAKLMKIVKNNVMLEAAKRTALDCQVFASKAYVPALLALDTLPPNPSPIPHVLLTKIALTYVLPFVTLRVVSRPCVIVGVPDDVKAYS